MAQPPRNSVVSTPFAFGGGLDQTSSSLAVPGGRVIAGLNYEPTVAGYSRKQGHERYDGRQPSSMLGYRLNYTAGFGGSFTLNATVTGGTSGATATVLSRLNVVGASGTLLLTNIVGAFVNGETIHTGVPGGTVSGTLYRAPDSVNQNLDDSAAQNWYRALIGAPPGSGPVRGGFVFNGVVYAVRDNAGATAGIIYKATNAGWAAQAFGRVLKFHLGLVEIAEGATVTGGTSGATAHVERVIVQDGAWGATLVPDQASGYLVLSGQAGAFQTGETLKVGATNCATNNSTADSVAISLPPGGRYAFKVKNFYGATNRKRAYGVNGVGTGFEYDGGSVLVPIYTGTPTDTPTRVFDIANALGLCLPGGSIQISEPGEPCVFNAILGALEIALGDDITDVIDSADDAVIFFAKEKIASLTGRGADTFVLSEITEEAGAMPWTCQRIGQISAPLTAQTYSQTLYLDRRGLRSLAAAATAGDFSTGAISELFQTYLAAKARAGANPVASLRCKSRSQYRIYYDDGTGFTVYMGGKGAPMLPFETDALSVYATFTGEIADGTEGMFACGNDGFLYRLDSGTSFDGVPIRAFLMLPFNHLGSIAMNKRFHGVEIELDSSGSTTLGVVAQFDYGDGEQPISGNQDFSTLTNSNAVDLVEGGGDFVVTAGGGNWDPAAWGSFYWSTAYQGMAEADIAGAGRNISLIIACDAVQTEPPHTLRSYTIRWSARGQVRRTAD